MGISDKTDVFSWGSLLSLVHLRRRRTFSRSMHPFRKMLSTVPAVTTKKPLQLCENPVRLNCAPSSKRPSEPPMRTEITEGWIPITLVTSSIISLSLLTSAVGGIIHLVCAVAISTRFTSWTYTAMLVLSLGASPVSNVPIHLVQPVSLAERQTSTIWTVPLRGWPNTGYCTMMRFGINKQQMVWLAG